MNIKTKILTTTRYKYKKICKYKKKLSSPPLGALQRSVQGWVRPLLHQTGGKRRWHELFMINITITMKTTMINDHELGGSYDLMTIL